MKKNSQQQYELAVGEIGTKYNPLSTEVQEYHKGLRKRFEETRQAVSIDYWTQRGFIFAIPKSRIPELNKKLGELLWSFGKEDQVENEMDSVYALTAYMFPLSLEKE